MSAVAFWEGPRLAAVPASSEVGRVFERTCLTWASTLGVSTPWDAVERLGWPVRIRGISRAGSSIRSLLVPRLSGGFSIVVNEDHNPEPERLRWLIAHEFAHSLFYGPQSPPKRIIGQSPAEEEFCDAFADLACAPVFAANSI